MTALPPKTNFTDPTVTEGGFKTAINNLRDYLSGLLGSDGTVATGVAALGLTDSAKTDIDNNYTVAQTAPSGGPGQLVNLGTVQATFTPLGGSATQTFAAADGVAGTDVVNGSQSFVQVDAAVTTGLEATYVVTTAYTNTTGKAQFHLLSINNGTTRLLQFQFYIGTAWIVVGEMLYNSTSGGGASLSIVVPPNVTWRVTALPENWAIIQ